MILIAIGANLPGPGGSLPLETCFAAVQRVREIAGLEFVALSSWYRTVAMPRGGYPDYCNGVLRLRGEFGPEELLARLHGVEAEFGRVRGEPNAPRTLDLDIIDMNGLVRATPAPILPHPRAHLRAFVLRPILDVAPGWRHPVLRQSVTSLLSELPPQGVQPWHDEGF
jgi:2-amino-4-hydroxy-6-hydroxymethyldihydropteridine diphosphokinase